MTMNRETLMAMTNQELTNLYNEMTGQNVAKWKKAKAVIVDRILAAAPSENDNVVTADFGPVEVVDVPEMTWQQALDQVEYRFRREAMAAALQYVVSRDDNGETQGLPVRDIAEWVAGKFGISTSSAKSQILVFLDTLRKGQYKKATVTLPTSRPHGNLGLKYNTKAIREAASQEAA